MITIVRPRVREVASLLMLMFSSWTGWRIIGRWWWGCWLCNSWTSPYDIDDQSWLSEDGEVRHCQIIIYYCFDTQVKAFFIYESSLWLLYESSYKNCETSWNPKPTFAAPPKKVIPKNQKKGRGREKKQPWGKCAERKALLEHSVVALPCFIVKQ